MSRLDKALQNYPRPYLTDTDLDALLHGTPDSRYGKVKRWLAQGKLLHIRRGLYCLTDLAGYSTKPHPFELAQYIYGPSYISLESALNFHQLIPEAVRTITSVTSKRACEFETPIGQFSYSHTPSENLFTEVELIKQNGYQFFMAKPWKAICDYVFCYRKNWKTLSPLQESLRISINDLPKLNDEKILLLEEYYQHTRINRFLKGIKKELNKIS